MDACLLCAAAPSQLRTVVLYVSITVSDGNGAQAKYRRLQDNAALLAAGFGNFYDFILCNLSAD